MRRNKEVFSAKTGTGNSTVVHRNQLQRHTSQPVMAKCTLSYGEAATITVNLQGSKDGGVTWTTIVSGTWTTGTPKYLHGNLGDSKRYHQFRLNISANTNVTVTKGYIGMGQVEN